MSKRNAHLMRAGVLQNLEPTLRSLGADIENILAPIGYRKSDFEDGDMLIGTREIGLVLERCVGETARPDFAYQLVSNQNISFLGGMGLLLQTSNNLQEMLDDLPLFMNFHARPVIWIVKNFGNLTAIQYHLAAPDISPVQRQIMTEIGICQFFFSTMALTKKHDLYSKITYAHPARGTMVSAENYFGIDVEYSTGFDALWLETEALQTPIANSNKAVHMAMKDQLNLSNIFNTESSLVTEVSLIIRSLLPNAYFTIDDVARCYGCDKRTLQRHLRQESGVTYQELLDRVRFDLVCQYFQSTKMPITEIAFAVGYSDSSNFSRAFRRYAGCTIAEWVEKHVTPDTGIRSAKRLYLK